MQFEPTQAADILRPVVVEDALSNIPIFGPNKADLKPIIQQSLQSHGLQDEIILDHQAKETELPKAFSEASTVAGKLRALRSYSKERIIQQTQNNTSTTQPSSTNGEVDKDTIEEASTGRSFTNRRLHEMLLNNTLGVEGFPGEAQTVLDHVMLLRAKEKYLFDCQTNRKVVSDDPWLRDVWAWIAGKSHSTYFPKT